MLIHSRQIYRDESATGSTGVRNGIITDNKCDWISVIPELKSKDKVGILSELSNALSRISVVSQDLLLQSLLERERMGSTGIGRGLAIPNCRLSGIERCYLAVGSSQKGIDFDAIDGQPVRLFFSFCSPIHYSEMHIRLLSDIGKTLKNVVFRNKLIKAWDKHECRLNRNTRSSILKSYLSDFAALIRPTDLFICRALHN